MTSSACKLARDPNKSPFFLNIPVYKGRVCFPCNPIILFKKSIHSGPIFYVYRTIAINRFAEFNFVRSIKGKYAIPESLTPIILYTRGHSGPILYV